MFNFFTNPTLEKLNSELDYIISNRMDYQPSKYNNSPKIIKDDKGIELKFILPGYESTDLQISIEDLVLTINTISDNESAFENKYELFDGIDVDSCIAEMKAGILSIKFKYIHKQKLTKTIKINSL